MPVCVCWHQPLPAQVYDYILPCGASSTGHVQFEIHARVCGLPVTAKPHHSCVFYQLQQDHIMLCMQAHAYPSYSIVLVHVCLAPSYESDTC